MMRGWLFFRARNGVYMVRSGRLYRAEPNGAWARAKVHHGWDRIEENPCDSTVP